MSPLYRGGRRQGTTLSQNYPLPWEGTIVYYCTGAAGPGAAAEAARTGLIWLPDGGHAPVTNLERVVSQGGCLRCPLCGLTKPVGYKRRKRIHEAGLTEVDISALPF